MWELIRELRSPEGTAGAGGEDATASPPSSAGDTTASDLLDGWNPFEPGQGPGEEGGDADPSPGSQQRAAGDAVPPNTPQVPQTPSAPDPVQAELARIAGLLAQDRADRSRQQQPQRTETAAPPGPRFNLQIPEAILNTIVTSEDPGERRQALALFANGLANTIHAEMAQEFSAQLRAVMQAVPRVTQNQLSERQTQQEMWGDFYNSYTNLPRTPGFMNFVANEAQALAREQHRNGINPTWSPEFRAALASRVYGAFGQQAPAPRTSAVPAPRQNGNGQRQPKPASFAAGNGGRGGGAARAATPEIQDIWDTLDLT